MRKKSFFCSRINLLFNHCLKKYTKHIHTSNYFPMVAYISKSWVSLMVHIKVIRILVSRGILSFFDMHVNKYKVGTGIGTGEVWDVQLGFGEQSCKLVEWTTNTWSPISLHAPTRLSWVTKLCMLQVGSRQGMRCPTRVWCVIMQVMRCSLWDGTRYEMRFYYDC